MSEPPPGYISQPLPMGSPTWRVLSYEELGERVTALQKEREKLLETIRIKDAQLNVPEHRVRCGECRYWDRALSKDGNLVLEWGWCHKRTPVLNESTGNGIWPMTKSEAGCWEGKEKRHAE